jgi:hypothetical protein
VSSEPDFGYPQWHTGLHVGEQAWETLRTKIRPAARRQPWESGLAALMGLPVYVEPGWDPGRWELVERGTIRSSGTIREDGALLPDVHFEPGRAIVSHKGE